MNPQLTLLLEIQDLRAQARELRSESQAGRMEQEHFELDLDEAMAQLEEKATELEEELEARVRRRFRRVASSVDRAVVPVLKGVCYGCLTAIPTATAGEESPNETLQSCENCGRFLYILP
ncbi:MAG: hypothetical protein KY453_04490 [Gemmatimonadetes bacterium]|nr:hypothetical protein [Gemmatimonadota bacterium]